MIASRVRDEVDSSSIAQGRNTVSELGHNNTNLKTVAILPASRSVPVAAFARKLQTALEGIGASTLSLNQATISSHLGKHAFTRMGKLKACLDLQFRALRTWTANSTHDRVPVGWLIKSRGITQSSMSRTRL